MENVYKKFLDNRAQLWLDKKIKAETKNKNEITEEMIKKIITKYQDEADGRYQYAAWIEKAIRVARPSMSTHPSTFTHSSVKTTAFVFEGKQSNDGYMRTGNVLLNKKFDVFGDAATDSVVVDIYCFLNETLSDGQTVYEHFEQNSDISKQFINSFEPKLDYDKAVASFKRMMSLPQKEITNTLLKQVYFPLGDIEGYHLLSILSSSPMIFEQKSRIDLIRFSAETQGAKANRKDNKWDEHGFDDLFNLTVLGYGGAHPKNISVLANQNGGRAYLLPSLPPTLEKRNIRLPRTDFFKNCVWVNEFKTEFLALHRLAVHWKNNVHVRTHRDDVLTHVIDSILTKGSNIRESADGNWTTTEHYKALPLYQKIWLDSARDDERDNHESWLDDMTKALSRWIFHSYKTCLDQEAISLGDGELLHVRGVVEDYIQQDREWFR